MTLSTNDMLALLDLRLAQPNANGVDPNMPVPVDWVALFARDVQAEWLVQGVWPTFRQVHMHAKRKTGKSLVSLWMACNMAMGRDPFTQQPIDPMVVAYLDYEMTEDDLLERVEEMGFKASDLTNLVYFLMPNIPKLDTREGGTRLLTTLVYYKCKALIIDTMSRVIAGDENSNDTYIKFYAHSGQALRSAGIAMFRLDHEGHESGRSRGASAKADDVDVIWQLEEVENGWKLNRMASRMAWVPQTVFIRKETEPTLRFVRADQAWPQGTLEKARELDDADVPLGTSRRKATEMLKMAGYTPGKATLLQAALNYRDTRILGV